MAQSENFTVRLDADLRASLALAAERTERSISWIMLKAAREWLAVNLPDLATAEPPRYRRPSGRPRPVEQSWLEHHFAKRIAAYCDRVDRATVAEVVENALQLSPRADNAGNRKAIENVLNAMGWVELIDLGDGSESNLVWFKSDPR